MPTSLDVPSGKKSNAKVIQYQLIEEDSNYKLIELSQRHRQALIASCTYLRWMSRHAQLPTDLITNDALDAWVSDLEHRLMTDIDYCAKMIGCINNDEDVREALSNFIRSTIGDFNSTGNYGEGMSDEEFTRNLAAGTNPTCDLDILFAQCRFIVKNTHEAVTEVLQDVELTSNAFEIAKNLWDSIPVIGATDDAAGANGWINMALYWQEAVNETYEAQWDELPGGVYDRLSYKLFCRCRHNCVINVDRILETYEDALSAYIAPPSLGGLVDLLTVLAGLDQETTFVVELAHYVAWGLVKLVGFLFGRRYNNFIDFAIRMKADEPDNDWEVLETIFGACPEEVLLTPVILQTPWSNFPIPSGYDLQPVVGEDGFWIANTEADENNNYWLVMQEENGEPFSIGSRSFPDGLVSAAYYGEIDGVITELFFTDLHHHNLTKVALILFGGTPEARMKFKFYRPG